MASEAFLYCRISAQTKAALIALARHQGLTGSALLKRMIDLALQSANVASVPIVGSFSDSASQPSRISIRLAPDDVLLLRERSAGRGMPAATYVSTLVRSHLRSVAPLPKAEYVALRKAMAELGALGRNLNQIARAANQGDRVAGPDREAVKAMIRVCEGLRDHVRGLLTENLRAWGLGHADTHT